MENKYLLSTLVRAKKILDFVKKRKTVTLNEIKKEFNLNSTTAFRLLYSLTELDFLVKNDRKYSLKSQVLGVENIQDINCTVVPFLKPIVDEYQLSAYVGIVFESKIVISQVIPTEKHPEDYQRLGESLPLNTTAMGKCALAFSSLSQQRDTFAKSNFESKTVNTLTDPLSLVSALKVIRKHGYALDDEEKEIQFRCLSVPLCKNNELVAVLGLSGTLTELKRSNISKLVKSLKQVGKEIELNLLE